MAQLVNIRLCRAEAVPWGFRLQGGKDFGQPLLIQKVNGGSVAERAGLQVGDALIRVNGADVQDLRHKDAQDCIVRAGNNIEMSIQRGGTTTWKPQVSAVGNLPAPGGQSPLPVTKTSLAAKPSTAPIASGHNVSPRPFGGASTPQMNGGGDVKALVNKQYNSPIGVYSEETIAETLSAQTEVLATGALGVNFMKNEKTYDSTKSEVLKMVQEVEKEPREPEPAPLSNAKYFSTTSHAVGGRATSPRPLTPIARQMGEPSAQGQSRPSTPTLPQDKPYMPPPSPMPGSPVCSECGKHIVGVFVRIKDKNLHVECFKCATCGSSLKNVGYYTINNKLYCDIHAKMVARQNPPAPNMDPITVAPGARIPTGAISSPTPSAQLPSVLPVQPPKVARLPTSAPAPPQPVSLPVSFPPSLPTAAPLSPQPGTMAPLPFHTPNAPAPKPFGSVAAPAPAPPTTIPFTPSAPQPNFGAPPSNFSSSKPQTDHLNPVIWPPNQNQKKVSVSEPKTASFSSKTEETFEAMAKKKMSICSQEVCDISDSCNKEICRLTGECYDNRPASPIPDRELGLIVKQNVVAAAQSHGERKSKRATSQTCSKMTYTEGVCAQSLATQLMMLAPRGLSPKREDSPEILDISSRPHGLKSLLPPACVYRSLTPTQIVVFPPNLPDVMVNKSRSPSPRPPTGRTNLKKTEKREDEVRGTPPSFVGLPVVTPKPQSIIDCQVEELEEAPSTSNVPVVMVNDESAETNTSELCAQDESQTAQISEITEQIEETEQEIYTKTSVSQKIKELETSNDTEISSKIIQEKPFYDKMYTKQEVEKIVKEELKKVFLKEEAQPKKDAVEAPTIYDLPTPVYASGGMATALSTASDRPFTPAPFPRVPEMSLYPNEPKPKPKERKQQERYVPIPEPTEPYFPPPPPPPGTENKDERIARALREVDCRSPMTEALTIAPERSYSPLPTTAKVDVTKLSSMKMEFLENTSSAKSTASSCPIQSVKPPITLSGTASAFKPTGNGNGSLIPKSTPLVYIPQLNKGVQETRMEERYGIDKEGAARGGKTKEMIAGFESSQNITDMSSEINEMEFSAMKSTEVQYGCAVAKNPPPQASASVIQKSAPSNLRGEHLLPSYQQWLGDIPVRNEQVRSMSPFPHQIRAPSMEPRPMPQPPNFPHNPRTQAYYSAPRSSETQKYSSCASQAISTMSANATKQQPTQTCALPHALAQREMKSYSQSQAAMSSQTQSSSSTKTINQSATMSTTSKMTSRSSRTVSPLAGKPASITTSGKQTFKPDIPARSLSPSWKADYVRSVQNLSPITVRLPSPVPPPLKPKGEQTQVTSANVTVKNKPKTTSASSKPPTSTQSTKTQTPGHCGTSKGCGTPPGTPKGRGSPTKHCGTSKGCNTPPGTPNEKSSPSKLCGTSQGCGKPERCQSPSEQSRVKFSAHQNAGYASHKSNISNKENITTSKMQSSEKKVASQTNMYYKSTTSSIANENTGEMYDARKTVFTNKLVGILKKSADETDKKTQFLPNPNDQSKRNPLQPSSISCNTSWQPYPTNLPLPRNCGVNPSSSGPNAGGAGGLGGGRSSIAGSTAPRRGRGVLNTGPLPGGRIPLCGHCNNQIRGPFITALGKIWCPEHFVCVNPKCKRPLQDIGFVEEDDGLYCEFCFEQYLAPACDKCRQKIKGDCLNAIGKHFHPECFKCSYCEKLFGNNPFFLEDGLPYCENDWNELFTTKCFSCGFPIEAGDRWVEALNNNYHSQCFNCTMCKKNLEGQSFFAKGGRPFCKNHAR